MKIGITFWDERIASVCDIAPEVEVWLKENNQFSFLKREIFKDRANELEKIDFFLKEKIDLLICGALSRRMEILLLENGIEVEGWIGASKQEILEELKKEEVDLDKFRVPCCRGKHRRRHRGRKRRLQR